MKTKILVIILFFTLSQCGYSPIYSKYNKFNLRIDIDSIDGDKEINNIIRSNIKKISKENSNKKFNIKINTNYAKTTLSKNKTGAASEYQLIATSNFTINDGKKISDFTIEEKIVLSAESNIFKEKEYETTRKNAFANSISEKFLLKLSTFK